MLERQCDTLAEILHVEFLVPIGMTAEGLAERMRVPVTVVPKLLNCELPLNVQLASRLANVFHTTPELWLGLPRSSSPKNGNQAPPNLLTA